MSAYYIFKAYFNIFEGNKKEYKTSIWNLHFIRQTDLCVSNLIKFIKESKKRGFPKQKIIKPPKESVLWVVLKR